MKRKYWIVVAVMLFGGILLAVTWSRTGKKEVPETELISIGFSQVGAESDWRTANSISIKNTFTLEKGYHLIFEDARQKQSNQIMAIRSFIQQDVDYIVFAPVVEDGWDTVLEEAKRAGIPVIVIDRAVAVADQSLFTSGIGSDFYLQGKKACEVLRQYVETAGISEVNIVNIQGTLGATSQVARTQALTEASEQYGWNLLAQESGEYTEAKAYEVMTEMLAQYDNINFVYCENDNEASGAIDAILAAGKTVGPQGDIKVISFDATTGGLESTLRGDIMIDVECNPFQGPEVEKIIKQLENGQTPEKQQYISEKIFTWDNSLKQIEIAGVFYDVEKVTKELIEKREY